MIIEWITKHARQRMAQRHLTEEHLEFVLKYGQVIHNGGAVFVFLGHRNIPDKYQADDKVAKLEGTTLVISHDGALITPYKNRDALKTIKRKLKQYIPKDHTRDAMNKEAA